MYLGVGVFDESSNLERNFRDNRKTRAPDFPYVLAHRFEYLVFSVFVVDTENGEIEACHTFDEGGRIWNAEPLLNQQVPTLLEFDRDACIPVYYAPHVLHCKNHSDPEASVKKVLETDRAAAMTVDLGKGLRLYLTAHVPCGFSESLFQGVIAYLEDIFGGFSAYASDLLYGPEKSALKSASYWIKFIKYPALVVFGRNCLLARNTAADRLLNKPGEVHLHNGRLALPDEAASLVHPQTMPGQVEKTTADNGIVSEQIGVHKLASGVQYYVETVPELGDETVTSDPIRSYFRKKILIVSSELSTDTNPNLIRSATGVTLQQARVIQQILSGKTLRQAAEEIGIRYNTARNHIAMAQQRLSVSSQIELVNLIRGALSISPDQYK